MRFRTSENRRFKEAIGQSWLLSAKLARKAGYWHTAYSALLQARQSDAPFTYLESAKIVRARGEPLRALQELENSLHASKLEKVSEVIDLTGESEAEAAEKTRMRAKVCIFYICGKQDVTFSPRLSLFVRGG